MRGVGVLEFPHHSQTLPRDASEIINKQTSHLLISKNQYTFPHISGEVLQSAEIEKKKHFAVVYNFLFLNHNIHDIYQQTKHVETNQLMTKAA